MVFVSAFVVGPKFKSDRATYGLRDVDKTTILECGRCTQVIPGPD
jgi:hypothetical protein